MVLLKNRSHWEYKESHYVKPLGRYMDTLAWETAFLALDPNFKAIRDLKDLYEEFNESFINNPSGATKRLDELIELYKNSNFQIFRDFSNLLEQYHDTIVNSFTFIENADTGEMKRLSNGPLESFNNIPSAYRSACHGVKNFMYTRNRILWAVRKDVTIKAIPYKDSEIKTKGKPRGPYKK